MWKDAVPPIFGGFVSLFVITLSSMVLTVQDGSINPSGNTFASVQLIIGVVGFLISLSMAVIWWRKPEQFRLEYEQREDPPTPSCMFNFFAFLCAISILSLSALILMSEERKSDEEGANPSDIYIFGAITVSLSCIALIYFGVHLFIWGKHKYQA